jgi:hypothetical protein
VVLEVAVLAVALAFIGLILAYTLITGMPPMPTAPHIKRVLLNAVPAELDGTIYELGSGWGTLAFPLARRHPGCRVVAIELSPLPWLVSRLWQVVRRLPNLTLRRADFFKVPLDDATLVVCYVQTDTMTRLRAKFEAELPPNAHVLSNTFAVPGWKPETVHETRDMYATKVYLYRV